MQRRAVGVASLAGRRDLRAGAIAGIGETPAPKRLQGLGIKLDMLALATRLRREGDPEPVQIFARRRFVFGSTA